jgi:hypothetical protein
MSTRGALSSWVMQPESEADHSLLPSAEVKYVWHYTCISPQAQGQFWRELGCQKGKCALNFWATLLPVFICLLAGWMVACGSVWVWSLVSDIKGGIQSESVWEQGAEEIAGPKRDEVRMQKTAQWASSWLVPLE